MSPSSTLAGDSPRLGARITIIQRCETHGDRVVGWKTGAVEAEADLALKKRLEAIYEYDPEDLYL